MPKPVTAAAVILAVVAGCAEPVGDAPKAGPATAPALEPEYNFPIDDYGNPDFNGIWQAMNTAYWNLETHAAEAGPLTQLAALGAIPAGQSVVVGGEIPYQDWAREKQLSNKSDWLALDPAVKCYLPGVPRATYMPFPFQIVQAPEHILITYEFAGASRVIYLNRPEFEHPIGGTWMGHSRGRFEDGSLVIEVDGFLGKTWLDRAGNFHSDALEVIERFTHKNSDVILYEAEISDPKVYERPWRIKMPLYRRQEDNARLFEFKCIEFAEDLIYGHLNKDPG